MEKEKNVQPIPFKLNGIIIREFATYKDAFSDNKQKATLNYQLDFGIDSQEKIFSVIAKCTFLQHTNPFIICGISCHFGIEPEAWGKQINADTNKISFPKQLAEHLAALTTGTLRGVLHTKLENSEFSQFMLPTLNVSKIVKDDEIIFDLNPQKDGDQPDKMESHGIT